MAGSRRLGVMPHVQGSEVFRRPASPGGATGRRPSGARRGLGPLLFDRVPSGGSFASVVPRPSVERVAGVGVAFLLASSSCGGAQTPVADASPDRGVQARLTAGPWRLIDYRPDVPLDPVTQALLMLQLRTMVINFDGRTMHAQSSMLNLVRPYTIEHVAGSFFDLVSPDPQGAGRLRSHCELKEDERTIAFRAVSDPWNGLGDLERDAP